MNARERFAALLALCGTPLGGDNLIRVDGILYAIDPHPRELANGALVGRIHRFMGGSFQDIGGFKIGADGSLTKCPDALRSALNPEARQEGVESPTAGRTTDALGAASVLARCQSYGGAHYTEGKK